MKLNDLNAWFFFQPRRHLRNLENTGGSARNSFRPKRSLRGVVSCCRCAEMGDARVGDTIIEAGSENEIEALPGYTEAAGLEVKMGKMDSHPIIPSGKRLHNYGKSLVLMGKSTISTGPFSIAMLVYQRVPLFFFSFQVEGESKSKREVKPIFGLARLVLILPVACVRSIQIAVEFKVKISKML